MKGNPTVTSDKSNRYLGTKRIQRAERRLRATDALTDAGIAFETRNNGAHLILHHHGITVDVWPSTGRWKARRSSIWEGRTIESLLKNLLSGTAAEERHDHE